MHTPSWLVAAGDVVDDFASGPFIVIPTFATGGWAISWYNAKFSIVWPVAQV